MIFWEGPSCSNDTQMRSHKLQVANPKKISRMIVCLLSAISLFMIAGCQQVQKPEVRGEGPLAVKMDRGITPPEFHAPLEQWRTTHKNGLNRGDFTERECVLCHDPKKSCNRCHQYIGVREISVAEVSLLWPDEEKKKE